MVTRKVEKEITVDSDDPLFNIFDPASEIPPVKLYNVLPGHWQFRTSTRDYGYNGQHLVQIEAIHTDYLKTASSLIFKPFNKMSDYAYTMSGHLSFLTEMTCTLSKDKITLSEYGCSIYSPSLSGYHPISVSRNLRESIIAVRIDLTHKF